LLIRQTALNPGMWSPSKKLVVITKFKIMPNYITCPTYIQVVASSNNALWWIKLLLMSEKTGYLV
jgi:hypothetical protein